jgi:uncharacterized protein YndB with AHSA1/START domain
MAAKNEPGGEWIDHEVNITRVFDAPRALVFAAWTDPKQVAKWWGPEGFTNPVCNLDVRPGGPMRIDMRGPDGTVYPMTGTYREIAEPERLVFTSAALDDKGKPLFEVLTTVAFTEQGGKTSLKLQARVIKSTGEAGQYLKGMQQGWTQSLQRLSDLLAQAGKNQSSTADREISATRIFDAPRELVFKMWTEPEHVAKWWGPDGFTNTIQQMEVRPGGVWKFVMHGPDGTDYPNKIVFIEVVKPERLVYQHGGGDESDPVSFHVTVTFEARGNKTKLTMRSIFPTAEQRNLVVEKYGAIEGMNQTLGRLADLLAQ